MNEIIEILSNIKVSISRILSSIELQLIDKNGRSDNWECVGGLPLLQ